MSPPPDPATSIQRRLLAGLPCFGCGPDNSRGLQLASFENPDGTVTAQFLPWPEHENGLGYLNGGIAATILDCHTAAAVTVEAHRRGWTPLPGAALTHVTACIDVRYLRPTPMNVRLSLFAAIVEATEDEVLAEATVMVDGKTCTTATSRWKRWRPR